MSRRTQPQDFTGKVMYGMDLRGQDLHRSTISLDCATFDGLHLDDMQVCLLVAMVCKARFSPDLRNGLDAVLQSHLGQARYSALSRFMDLA